MPHTDETKNFFDYEKFKLMKEGSIFINIGRGTTVVEDDLIRALDEGHLRGAALDVFALEPLSCESKLWGMKNVLMTPHCADLTADFLDLLFGVFKRNYHSFDAGEGLLTVVNKDVGY